MFTSIITQLALLFTTPTAIAPDACSVTHRITGYPTICEPHRLGAPVYGKTICCAGGSCFPSVGGCQEGERLFECELGEVDASGRARCYFEVLDYCDVHTCPPGDGGGWEDTICCSEGVCLEYPGFGQCEGDILFCVDGATNDDGTVTCFDEDL